MRNETSALAVKKEIFLVTAIAFMFFAICSMSVAKDVANSSMLAVVYQVDGEKANAPKVVVQLVASVPGGFYIEVDGDIVARKKLPSEKVASLLDAVANECSRLGIQPYAPPGESSSGPRAINTLHLYYNGKDYLVGDGKEPLPAELMDIIDMWVKEILGK